MIDRRRTLLGGAATAIVAAIGIARAEPRAPDVLHADNSSAEAPVDPAAAPFNADATGSKDAFSAFTAAFQEATARARVNGGTARLKPSPGRYLIRWDGATGFDVNPVGRLTGLNQRYCFVVDDPAVKRLILDLTDVTLVHGGRNWTEWASLLLVDGAALEVVGGVLDYECRPFLQGVVSAVGRDSIDVALDPAFGETPSFSEVFEIVNYGRSETDPAKRFPVSIAFDRDAYTKEPLRLSALGAGVVRLSGVAASEIGMLSRRAPVGTLVVCKGATDGPAWFNAFNAPQVTLRGVTCHASAESVALTVQCGQVTVESCRIVPRPGSNALAVTMRGGFDVCDTRGRTRFAGNDFSGTGDDPIALYGQSLARLTRLGPDAMRAFSVANYYTTLSPNLRFVLYDAGYAEVARGEIVEVGPFRPDYTRDLRVALSSGALPDNLAGHIAQVVTDLPKAEVVNNRIRNVRARAIWTGVSGLYANNTIEDITDEAILFQSSKTNPQDFYTGGDGVEIIDNVIRGACRSAYYAAAIRVFATRPGALTAATGYPLKNVTIRGNLIEDCPNQAILLGGVDGAEVVGNTLRGVSSRTPSGELADLGFSASDRAAFGYVNCRRVRFRDNALGFATAAREVHGVVANGGANGCVAPETLAPTGC